MKLLAHVTIWLVIIYSKCWSMDENLCVCLFGQLQAHQSCIDIGLYLLIQVAIEFYVSSIGKKYLAIFHNLFTVFLTKP